MAYETLKASERFKKHVEYWHAYIDSKPLDLVFERRYLLSESESHVWDKLFFDDDNFPTMAEELAYWTTQLYDGVHAWEIRASVVRYEKPISIKDIEQ